MEGSVRGKTGAESDVFVGTVLWGCWSGCMYLRVEARDVRLHRATWYVQRGKLLSIWWVGSMADGMSGPCIPVIGFDEERGGDGLVRRN